jgi:hypothetical protein
MSDNIFDLVYSDYDWQEHYFFDAPEGATLEDFQKLCDSLMPQAGYKATIKRSDIKKGGWICWSDVVESLISLLEGQGYQRVDIDSYEIDGGSIIGLNEDELDPRLGFSVQGIVVHNRKLEKKLSEERKLKRSLRLGALKKKTVQIIK